MRSTRDENNILKGRFDVEMNLWALESIGVVALGGRLKCFDENLSKDSPERRLIQLVHELFAAITDLEFKPNLSKIYPTKLYKKTMNMFKEQEE